MSLRSAIGAAGFAAALGLSSPLAAAANIESADLQAVLDRLAAQEAALGRQQAAVARQQQELDQQRQELSRLRDELQRQLQNADRSQAAGRDEMQVVAVAPYADPAVATGVLAPVTEQHKRGLEISGYGVANYFQRDWDTDEFAKDSVDTERFVMELEYYFDANWKAVAEIEYEHGGTGAKLEFDSQEEFGEFEQEVENGGEVVVEELYVAYHYEDWLNLKFGRFYVPVGRTNLYHKPQDYFTVTRSDADSAMIPQGWYETGVAAFGSWSFGDWGHVEYQAQVVNGLDSTGFSSRNWVAGGHQTRFDQQVAEDLAFAGRLGYFLGDDIQVAGAYYGGNTNKNRPKNDLQEDAYVDILEFDGAWTPGDFIFRGQYMWGRLQNSHLVTEANRNLSNNLGVKRTPVAAEARSWWVEAGYDLFGQRAQSLIVYGRYDDYDPMHSTEGLVFDNPRWHATSWSAGLNYLPIPNIIFKAEYNRREVDLDSNYKEDTMALGVGFTY